jgi:hypothetical protein
VALRTWSAELGPLFLPDVLRTGARGARKEECRDDECPASAKASAGRPHAFASPAAAVSSSAFTEGSVK